MAIRYRRLLEMDHDYDIVIIGTGAGGGTLVYGLRDSGARILLIEQGDYLPQETENWDAPAVFLQNRYRTRETWDDAAGRPYHPGIHYYVGGNTKVYGAALPRFRQEDFAALEHEGGTSPDWPLRYQDFEPYYARAEAIYRVHGHIGEDPTEPPRSLPFPYPEVPHESPMAELADALRAQDLHPFFLPLGIDLREGGACIRCKTCDGFPCRVLAKSDADVCCVRPALQRPGITLMTRTHAVRLRMDPTARRVAAAEVERDGKRFEVRADRFVVACGAVNSAALLLRSGDGGIANSSGLVGRHYMVHNNTALVAVSPLRRNPVVFQKTMAVNDFYLKGPGWNYPMGNLQLLGKVQTAMLASAQPWAPRPMLNFLAGRSIDWWVMSEDLPDHENRVTVTSGGRIQVQWRPNNTASHRKLVAEATKMMKQGGYPLVFTKPMGIETNSHQCGTLRFGTDPATSVLDPSCRSHDVSNLYVVDASFFPSSAAVNPALTIAAQALRVADHLMNVS
jgi:choline dehydrogenase-like flavoprotein